jgi:hypothetical protein
MAGEKWVARATKAERLGRPREAIDFYLKAVAAQPRNVVAYARLGNLFQRAFNPFDALKCYQKALALKPDEVPLLRHCIAAAIAAVNPGAADHHLRPLLTVRPRDPEGLLLAGDLIEMMGDHAKVEEWYRVQSARVPGEARLRERRDRLAAIHARMAQSEERYRAALRDAAAAANGPPKTYFVTLATADLRARQDFVARSAVAFAGVDGVVSWDEATLPRARHVAQCRHLLHERRGVGFYSWKPLIILEQLERVRDGDWVVYSDVGRVTPYPIFHDVEPLRAWALHDNGGVFPGIYIPDCGPNRRWTKRDCFVRMDCDGPEFWDEPQLQGSFSLWRKSATAVDFVRTWLQFASDRAVMLDDPHICGRPNLPAFVDHRHDRSVLTNLALKRGLNGFGRRDRPLAPHPALKRIDFVTANFAALR